ncbi:hypothetical protein K488DRAFT_83455 [Vararia minispora EC-137]|uniref:Uncharacterized protein n=1 Tax=Vararia minispora EC-137 TaxID=1314806 RepID=A0ACB8QT39_9AGAM|nr:hypothetical protein K488DRAFT_83455 [Vararia minispora EC-137]
MFSSAVFLYSLLALAPFADATLQHGSARHSRHNGRSLGRRINISANSTAPSSARCTKRSHKPSLVATVSLDATATAAVSASASVNATVAASATATPKAKASATAHVNANVSSASSSKLSTASSSAAASASTSSSHSSSGGLLSGLLGALFPVSTTSAWTTASGASSSVSAVSLSTSNLAITSEIKALSNPISTFQGKTAMQATFPAGCWGLEKGILGGMSWYGAGQTSRAAWNGAKEVTFGYSLFFDNGFDFNKGGKLPGLYFGKTEQAARSCSGGSRNTECASVRLMWRSNGAAEFYTYLPSPSVSSQFDANKALCSVAPQSDCNAVYGASVGRGAFSWQAGQWNNVAMRVRLNDNGQANGEIELFYNGVSKINVGGLIIAASKDSTPVRAQGIMSQMFFGGSDSSWASPKDQSIHVSDFSVAVTQTW